MCRFATPLFALSLISVTWICGAFVSPVSQQIRGAKLPASSSSHSSINSFQLDISSGTRTNRVRYVTCIASKSGDSEDEKEGGSVKDTIDDADDTLPIDLFSGEISEKVEPSLTSKVTLGIFKLFSYCLQFVGAFFFCGLILNLLGFGYTFDFEHGLVVDRIQNIRNEVQFEQEIQREEREDLMGTSGSASSKYIIAPSVPEVSTGDI